MTKTLVILAGLMLILCILAAPGASAIPLGNCGGSYDVACTGHACDGQGNCISQFCVIHWPNAGSTQGPCGTVS
jgi:hypothetical protein